jgi:hypothetical protein
MTIATGIFKQVAYAKESTFGVLGTRVSGEGLLSPATITGGVTYAAAATAAAVATAILAAGTTGTFLVGQVIKINGESFKVTAATHSATGVTTALTLNNAAVAAANNAIATLVTSTAVDTITVPSAAGSTSGSNMAGDNNTLLATVTGIYALGQQFTLAGLTQVFTVTGVTNNATTTTEITFAPALPQAIATGVAVTLSLTGSTPKIARRVTSNIELKKATFKSNEIRTDMQRADFRHGGKSVDGSISGELSSNSYSDFIAAVLRRNFSTPAATFPTAVTPSLETAVGARLTATTGTFANVKVGSVIKATAATGGWLSLAAGGLNRHLVVLRVVSSTVIDVRIANGVDLWVGAAGYATAAGTASSAVTFATVGKNTFIPTTGHTNDSFSVEHWFSDIAVSEVFKGCRATQLAIKAPASGLVTADISFMGQNMTSGTTSVLAAGAQAIGTDSVFSSAVGAIYIDDVIESGLITAFDITINGNGTKGDCVGSDVTPDVFVGAVDVSGNLTAYFENTVLRDKFLNESEGFIVLVLTTGAGSTDSAGSSTFTVTMPRIKLTGATKDDGEKGLSLSAPFTAILGKGTNGFEATTIQVHDSNA